MLGMHFSPYHQGDQIFYDKLETVDLWCCKPTYAGHTFLPIPSRRQDIVQQTWNGRPMMLQAYLCWECNFPHTINETRYFIFYDKLEMVGLWCCKPTYAGHTFLPIPARRQDIVQQTWNCKPMTLQAYLSWECNFPHTIKETRHFATNLKW